MAILTEKIKNFHKSKVDGLKKLALECAVCFFILFVLMDATLLSLTLQKRTMYKKFLLTFNAFV